jgi:hypothetical protein
MLGRLRDFRWNDQLRSFIPDASGFSLSWIELAKREVLRQQAQAGHSLLVFYAGSGEVLSDLRRAVSRDDVVVVPAGCEHTLVAGDGGLSALTINFASYLVEAPDVKVTPPGSGRALELLEHNERCKRAFARHDLFLLLEDGTLENASARKTFVDAMSGWLDGVSSLFLAHELSCTNPAYGEAFGRHRRSVTDDPVVGNRIEADRGTRDPILEALRNWFPYQMHVLDDAEKVGVVSLVVAEANTLYLGKARRVLGRYMDAAPAWSQGRPGLDHAVFAADLLCHEPTKTLDRVERAVNEAWSMVHAVASRVVALSRQAARQ